MMNAYPGRQVTQPVYSTPHANDAVPLYAGNMRLVIDQTEFTGPGTVSLDWLPFPGIHFKMEIEGKVGFDPFVDDAKLELKDLSPCELIEVRITSASMFLFQQSYPITGQILSWTSGESNSLKSLKFHVPNFRFFLGEVIKEGNAVWVGGSTLQSCGWKIHIDQIRHNDTQLKKELKATGGYAITHAGNLSREDGSEFKKSDAEHCLNGLYWFLSFCNGRWTGPIMQAGFHDGSDPVHQKWALVKTAPYGSVRSWFSDVDKNIMEQVYPGFSTKWADPVWAETLKKVIYWYLISNARGSHAENGIILLPIALDMLAWTLFVEKMQTLSISAYENLKATGRTKLLLDHCRISQAIPDDLSHLQNVAETESWNDGPTALVRIRNANVHPSTSNLELASRIGGEGDYQAWALGMHYLELVLLHLMEFNGDYSYRLVGGVFPKAAVRPVPWKI